MLRLASDEDFHGAVVRGLLRRDPGLDLVRIQDAGIRTADDQTILAWAAANDRILLTHDRHTMPAVAAERIRLGLPMPGILVVKKVSVREMIEEILIVVHWSEQSEWKDVVGFLPL
jgi:predicted nuclease of predicted toxin-antitoxin system